MGKYTKINLLRMGGTSGQDNHTLLQSLIENNPSKKIIIPSGMTCLISKPLIPISNTCLQVDGDLKLTDGVVRSLTQDAATGQKRVYVNNSDGAYKVGQWVSVGATDYATGGGGNVARKMAQAGEIVTATATYIEFEFNLRTDLSGVSVGDLLVANGATIGHAQTMIYCRNVDNIIINGSGMLDGKFPTMHGDYHPCAIGGDTASVAGYETTMGGNGIVFWNCNNLSVQGVSMQEFNIGGILGVEIYNYRFGSLQIYHPYMKHLAFSLGADYGLCEDGVFDTSYNEDGVSLHDLVSNTKFKNIAINDCPRIGFGIGSGSFNITIKNVTVDGCNLSLYSYPSSTGSETHDIDITDFEILDGIAGLSLGMGYNWTFNNFTVRNGRAGNHCITVGGQCDNIVFNGGGCYDTKLISSNSGWGFRTVPKESYHDSESTNIIVNDFEFTRLNRGIVDLGSFPVTFNRAAFSENDLNGDLDSADFTLVDCTVEGAPYP